MATDHVSTRWAQQIAVAIKLHDDPRTVERWSRAAGISRTQLNVCCRLAGLSPKASLDFAVGSNSASAGADALDTSSWGFDSGLFAASYLTYPW